MTLLIGAKFDFKRLHGSGDIPPAAPYAPIHMGVSEGVARDETSRLISPELWYIFTWYFVQYWRLVRANKQKKELWKSTSLSKVMGDLGFEKCGHFWYIWTCGAGTALKWADLLPLVQTNGPSSINESQNGPNNPFLSIGDPTNTVWGVL